jgi:hypothetical protein
MIYQHKAAGCSISLQLRAAMHHLWRLKVSSSWEFLLAHSNVVLSAVMKKAAIDAVDQSQNYTVKTFIVHHFFIWI